MAKQKEIVNLLSSLIQNETFLKEEFKEYISLLPEKEKLREAKTKVIPETGDLRELLLFPPVYVILADKPYSETRKLFTCLILTREVFLGWHERETELIILDEIKTVLVLLPFWIYLTDDILYNHSERIKKIPEEEAMRYIEHVKRQKIPEGIRGEYVKTVMKRLSGLNTISLLSFLDFFD